MGHRTLLTIVVAASLGASGGGLDAQSAGEAPLEARLWVGWEDEPVVRRGERVRIQYRTSMDAFVAVFRIDTDGRVALLYPSDPRDDGLRPGGRDEELVLAASPYWTVADDPGMGYMFLVASPVPFDFSRFGFHRDFGWDLSSVATTVYDDPYLAMDDFIAAILPDWRAVGYALDFVTYHVDEHRSYPRFLCYDCHTYQSFDQWNPYDAMCSSYRVVVYDDPYYYPVYRYAGTRVVYPMPLPNRPRYEMTARRSGKAWAPIVRVRAAPPAQVAFKESPTSSSGRRDVGGSAARARDTGVTVPPRATRPSAVRGGTAAGSRSGATGTTRPSAAGGSGVRTRSDASPSGARPVREAPVTRRAPPRATDSRPSGRTPTERRVPAARSGGTTGQGARSTGARPSTGRPAVAPPATRRRAPSPARGSGSGARPSSRPSGDAGRRSPSAGRGSAASPPTGRGTRPTRPGARPGPG